MRRLLYSASVGYIGQAEYGGEVEAGIGSPVILTINYIQI